MAQLNFDATQVAPDTGGGDPVPAGWYNAQIDQSEMKPTKDGQGAYLDLRFTILDGQYANRKVFTGLNLKNANPVAQEIAYRQLSAICHAVGIMQVQDSQQLHGRPLKIKVKVRAAYGDYEASNDITSYKNINEQADGPVAGAAPAGAPWATAPAAAPVAPAPQFAPQQPAPAPAAPAWQPPAAQQPWAQPAPQQPAAAPAPQYAPQPQAPAPQPAPAAAPQPGATPPWMQQAAAPAAPGATPPWAQPQQ